MNIWLEKYLQKVEASRPAIAHQLMVEDESNCAVLDDAIDEHLDLEILEEKLLNGREISFEDMCRIYNANLARHDDLEAIVNSGSDSPKQKRMIEEHARMCDHMNRLITSIRAAGHTITGDEILYGYEV